MINQFSLTISRNSDDIINLTIKDNISRLTFVELNLTLEQYALASTGLSYIECSGSIRQLDKVGKEKITEERSVVYPKGHSYDKTLLRGWLIDNCQEKGWELDSYLGSKDSVTYPTKDGKQVTLINYSVVKYV